MASSDPLPIANLLTVEAQPIVLLGWSHSVHNSIIPNLLKEQLVKLKMDSRDVALVFEWPEGRSRFGLRTYGVHRNMGSLTPVLEWADANGFETVQGDHPDHDFDSSVTNPNREKHFANVLERIRSSKRLVILIVGGEHLLGIGRELHLRGIPFSSLSTEFNVFTGQVRLGNLSLGFAEPDSRFAHLALDMSKQDKEAVGWGRGRPRTYEDHLLESRQKKKNLLKKGCEALLSWWQSGK